jgi:hypothetical protein
LRAAPAAEPLGTSDCFLCVPDEGIGGAVRKCRLRGAVGLA